jgi:hypothetical protein
VFGNTLGARVGARASALGTDFRRPTLKSVLGALAAFVCIGAAAALFFGWLMLSDSGRLANRGLGPDQECTSLGRGGAHCVGIVASSDPLGAGASAAGDCRSMGRAGRICVAHSHE